MTDYYMLECFAPSRGRFLDILEYPLLNGIDSWILGSIFTALPPVPITLCWDPDSEGEKKTFYDATIPLMHRDLVASLESFGIDNIDKYPVEILDINSEEIDKNYLAVNIIGTVAAADLSRSEYIDYSGNEIIDIDFDSLKLSGTRTHNLSLFRLAECATGIVISDYIKNMLEKAGGYGLSFISPEDWIG